MSGSGNVENGISINKMVAVELFSGAGGLSLGLEKSGFSVVLANEIEKDFAETFRLNHPKSKMICDDIRSIDFKKEMREIGTQEVTLLSGGPPCQGFSTVGSKKEEDPRNSLFYEYIRAVNEINPSYVIFENVAGFMRMYKGRAYETLLKELDASGYFTSSGILEASDFGLPQKRERTIVVGWKKNLRKLTFPFPSHCNEHSLFNSPLKLSLMDAISDLPKLSSNDSVGKYLSPPLNEYQKKLRIGCEMLTEHNSSNYGKKMLEILSLIPPNGTVQDLPKRLRPKSYFLNTYARLDPDKPSPTITRNFGTPSSSRCIHPYQDRALSTREGARLQGFPDSYIFCGSKTSKNLQIGNAVPPIFGEVVAKMVVGSILSSDH